MNNYRIYSHSNAKGFADLVAKKLNLPVYSPEVKNFADGEINVTINESVRGYNIIYIAKIEMPYRNFFEALLFCDAARRASANQITMVVPYLIHSRQERRDDKRSPITARLFADMVEQAGVDRIISMDIHTGAIEGFYSIPFDKIHPTNIFVEKIRSLNLANPKLVAPDAGFAKKLKYYAKELNYQMAIIDKTRNEANKVDEMMLIGNVKGCNVIIVDDMVDTAGTLVKAAHLCLQEGAKSVNVFATHGVLSYRNELDNAVDRLRKSKISKVYLSNTICEYYEDDDNGKIEVIDVTSVFADAIKKIISETAHMEPAIQYVNYGEIK